MSLVPLEPATAQPSKPRILLVDDRMANLISLQAILDEPGRELVSVSSGAEALQELEARDFALVVLDVQMPGMDGFEVAARMKDIARAQHVPIVFVTAIDRNEKYVARAYEQGAVDFIQKPFEAETMRAKAAVFLDLYVTKEHLASTLKEADSLKQQFLSTLSHELRAPLTAILAWTRMVRDGSIGEPQRGRALENIERNASAQLALVEGMTDISAMAAGQLVLELEMVDLSNVIELAIQTVRPSAAEKKIPLHAALERDVAPVRGDARRLRQIVLQLLENAVKFTSATGGIVTVSLCNVGPDVEIVVEDTGVGIEPALLPRLFAPLAWRAVGARRAEGGLGVGLTIVGHLVELHEGTIRAESAGRGQGSRFVVKLPANGPKPRETSGTSALA